MNVRQLTYIGDDSVEGAARIAETVLAGGKLTEVLRRLRDDVVVELEDDTASGLVVDGDVELCVSPPRVQ